MLKVRKWTASPTKNFSNLPEQKKSYGKLELYRSKIDNLVILARFMSIHSSSHSSSPQLTDPLIFIKGFMPQLIDEDDSAMRFLSGYPKHVLRIIFTLLNKLPSCVVEYKMVTSRLPAASLESAENSFMVLLSGCCRDVKQPCVQSYVRS